MAKIPVAKSANIGQTGVLEENKCRANLQKRDSTMIVYVEWQYVILNGSSATGFRVKRRMPGNPPPINQSGFANPNGDAWQSTPAPASIPFGPNNDNYIFAFWSVTAVDMLTQQRSGHIQSNSNTRIASDSHVGGMWKVTAKAYYIWDFGSGEGNHALLIDAYDVQAGDFIADDFVDAAPDDSSKTMTKAANEGYIDTTAQLTAGQPLTVTARKSLAPTSASPSYKDFGWWENSYLISFSAQKPATVGAPNAEDIVVNQNDIVVAFAMYNEVSPPPIRVPEIPRIGGMWVSYGVMVDGGGFGIPFGGGPPVPIDPWTGLVGRRAMLGVSIANAATEMSPELRDRALRLAADQLKLASEEIRQGMKSPGK